jgi:hypothetical protein
MIAKLLHNVILFCIILSIVVGWCNIVAKAVGVREVGHSPEKYVILFFYRKYN